MDAAKTLKTILSLIDKDVRLIKSKCGKNQLAPEVALTLSRYANMLGGIIEDGWKAKEKAKKKYEKMTTEELVKLYTEQKKKKDLP